MIAPSWKSPEKSGRAPGSCTRSPATNGCSRCEFRVPKKTFDQDRLQQQLALKSLDDLDELPVYGRSDRVRVRNVKGSWQEVAVTVHWLREIETPAFDKFLENAADAFLGAVSRKKLNPADLTPWKVLGRKWHVSRKGFPSGKRIRWEPDLLERLFDLLAISRPAGRNRLGQQAGRLLPPQKLRRRVGGRAHQAAARRRLVALQRIGPRGPRPNHRAGPRARNWPARSGRDQISIRFDEAEQVTSTSLAAFLKEHAAI